jgi:hypothetical protein
MKGWNYNLIGHLDIQLAVLASRGSEIWNKGKVKTFAPVLKNYTVKMCGWNGDTIPRILEVSMKWRWDVIFTLQLSLSPVLIEQEAVQDQVPAWCESKPRLRIPVWIPWMS